MCQSGQNGGADEKEGTSATLIVQSKKVEYTGTCKSNLKALLPGTEDGPLHELDWLV